MDRRTLGRLTVSGLIAAAAAPATRADDRKYIDALADVLSTMDALEEGQQGWAEDWKMLRDFVEAEIHAIQRREPDKGVGG